MSGIFPDWFSPVTTINSSQTVVSATTSKVSLPTRPGRQYLKLTNLGPNTAFVNFKSLDADTDAFRLANGEILESTLGFRIVDTVSVIASTSATAQRLLKIEAY